MDLSIVKNKESIGYPERGDCLNFDFYDACDNHDEITG